jgi:hypothetical protein
MFNSLAGRVVIRSLVGTMHHGAAPEFDEPFAGTIRYQEGSGPVGLKEQL